MVKPISEAELREIEKIVVLVTEAVINAAVDVLINRGVIEGD